tara:strand:- start:153 stop:788 length:636 start_codon:yes stop_codon:yes gene_type:complete
MPGYIGQREKRRQRRIIFFIIFIIFLSFLFYLYSNQNMVSKNLENDFIIAEDNAIEDDTLGEEDYKIKIFEKEQKIIFRDKQIDKLKKENTELEKLNKILSKNNDTLKTEISNKLTTQDNQEIKSLNSKLIELNKLVEKLKSEKSNLLKKSKETNLQNDTIKDKIQLINNEKTNLGIQNNLLSEKNKKLEKIIDDQEKLIRKLKDTTHHNR